MLGLLQRRHVEEARKVLARQMDQDFSKKFRSGHRGGPRGGFCQAVWIVPVDALGRANFQNVFSALTKDISTTGLAFLHSSDIPETRVLVGFEADGEFTFIRCRRSHSTHLGLGHFQIGLVPERIASVSVRNRRVLKQWRDELAPQSDDR